MSCNIMLPAAAAIGVRIRLKVVAEIWALFFLYFLGVLFAALLRCVAIEHQTHSTNVLVGPTGRAFRESTQRQRQVRERRTAFPAD